MTYAPESLKAARGYLLAELDMHPGQEVDADLDPDEVGIVSSGYGDSYHRGKGYIGDGSYSAYFERDKRGLSGASSALDIGEFEVVKNGRQLNLFAFNRWLVAQCEANTPDTQDIREVIYTLDGKTVKRWDRHKRRDSGDSSHLWHTHISYYRDSEYRDKTALFRRYIEGDDDMPLDAEDIKKIWEIRAISDVIPAPRFDAAGDPLALDADGNPAGNPRWTPGTYLRALMEEQRKDHAMIVDLVEKVDSISTGGVDVDAFAEKVADLLSQRLQD